jgi:alanine racemase
LNAIQHNIHRIKSSIGPGKRLMSVVKANAYGHGGVEVARAALGAGADDLGVATLNEAVELREAGIAAPILVLGYVPPAYYGEALQSRAELTVFSEEDARLLARAAQTNRTAALAHVKINTGMNRLGFEPTADTAEAIVRMLSLPGLTVRGIFTHFAASDQADTSWAERQFSAFQAVLERLRNRGVSIPVRHCANSAAIAALPHTHLDMVRAGIICYGLKPSAEVPAAGFALRPAMSLKSRLVQIRLIEAGETVGYGGTYRSETPRRVATVPIGYADGYSRLLSNRAAAWLHGRRIPLVGRVCMDQCVFDVTDAPQASPGDELLLFGPAGVTADDIGGWSGTINYEVVSTVGARVPRVYIKR